MRERLAIVQFRGVIRERSAEPFVRLFRSLRTVKRIRGVLVDLSSGGGAVIPSVDLYLALKRLDAVKPVVASIGGEAASGGYLAALGARRLFAYPDSIVGSIGVVHPHFAARGLLDKLGIEVELVHSGRHKDAFQGFRSLTDEERTKLQSVSDDTYRNFVGLVARERHRSVEEILPLATGEFWSGRRAAELGLIDRLGDREEALEELGRLTGVAPTRTVLAAPPRSFVERFFSGGGLALGASVRAAAYDVAEELRFGGFSGGLG